LELTSTNMNYLKMIKANSNKIFQLNT